MDKVDILMPVPIMESVEAALDGPFTLTRAFAAGDPGAAMDEVAARVRGMAVGLGFKVDAAFIDRFPKLEIMSCFGIGYDPIDAAYAAKRGIVVTNTPDVLTEEVADTALGLLIMTVRELSAAERHLRAGRWAGEGHYPLTRMSLGGKKLGILGLGRIGKAIARRASACGLEIVYCGRNKQPDQEFPYFNDLKQMSAEVDILLAVLPGGAATRHLIDAGVLEALGPDGVLINIGRGSVVDEAALIAALKAGTIHAAGLDVFENEPNVPADLIAMDNVVLLPHVASASIDTRRAMGKLQSDNLHAWFGEGRALTPVAESAEIAARGRAK